MKKIYFIKKKWTDTLVVTTFLLHVYRVGCFRVNFDAKTSFLIVFPYYFFRKIIHFHIFLILLRLILWFRCHFPTLVVMISCFCALCFLFPIIVRCFFFYSVWKISFELCRSSQLHKYFEDLNIVIFVGIGTLPFYVINFDGLSLFTYSSFLFLAILNLYCFNVLIQFEWIDNV